MLVWFVVYCLLQLFTNAQVRTIIIVIGLIVVVLAAGGFALQIGHHGIVAS